MESASAWPFEYSKLGIVEIYPHNLGDRQRLEHLGIEELLGVGKFTRTAKTYRRDEHRHSHLD